MNEFILIGVYLARASLVLETLTNNFFLYLIFAEWRVYLFFLCQRKKVRTIRAISNMPLLQDSSMAQKCFVKEVGDDEEVEYSAPPLVIYREGTKRSKSKS